MQGSPLNEPGQRVPDTYRGRISGAVTGFEPEVEDWLAAACGSGPLPPLLVVIGLGDGRLLHLLDTRAPDTRVLAIEPEPKMAATCLAHARVRDWRDTGRLRYVVGPDYQGADEAWLIFPKQADAYKLIVHPRLDTRSPAAVRAAHVAKGIVFGVRANTEARQHFAPRYLTNVLRNVPRLAMGYDVRMLTNVFQGVPAVIAAAGPSLDAALAELPGITDRAVMIAADTALRPLLHAGLAPQLVIGADPGAANARHFHGLPDCPDTWLVSESALDPYASTHFGDRTFWFKLSGHHPWPWLNSLGLDVGRIEMWGSVLTAAFQVACLAGCDPIVFAGADLAFTGGRPYCRGTTYEFDWAVHTANGQSLDDVWQLQMAARALSQVTDLHGAATTTTPALESFRDWLVARAARSGRRVINATDAGILFGAGIEQQSLARVGVEIDPRPSTRPAVPRPSPGSTARQAAHAMTAALAPPLRAARRGLAGDGPATPLLTEWCDFAGDRLDSTALAVALDETLRALEPAGAKQERSTRETVQLIVSGDAVNALVPSVPEAMARFRAALAHDPLTPPGAMLDPGSALVAAFDLLQRIYETSLEDDDLPAPLQTADIDHVPVGSRFWLTEPQRWAVAVFEGLLGAAWVSTPPLRPATSFDSRPVVPREEKTTGIGSACTHPHATQACALLALEWLRGLAGQPGVRQSDAVTLLDWWHQLVGSAAAGHAGQRAGATLVLHANAGGATRSLEFALPVEAPQLARVLTGAVLPEHEDTLVLPRMETHGLRVSVGLRLGGDTHSPAMQRRTSMNPPRQLIESGTSGSIVAYAVHDGVVCVPLNTTHSLLVQAAGTSRPHLSWPRSIVLELPFGETGAVAWSNGLADWRKPIVPYVMYRRAADDAPVIEELPFRPGLGTWWRGRVYWCCQPGGPEGRGGVASWAPGESPRCELPDLALFDIVPHGDALLLHPRAFNAGIHERRWPPQGWLWRPGRSPEPVPLDPFATPSCLATSGEWTASTYLEADVVQIRSPHGTVSLTCYTPHRVAWMGRSLLVNTFEWDVLLFDDLMTSIEHCLT